MAVNDREASCLADKATSRYPIRRRAVPLCLGKRYAGQVRAGQVCADQIRASQVRAGQIRSVQVSTGQIRVA